MNVYAGAFARQQKMRDMGVDKLFQSLLMYPDQNLTEVYVFLCLASYTDFFLSVVLFLSLQCFETVGWAAGRASGM